jgi:hypothetical protein
MNVANTDKRTVQVYEPVADEAGEQTNLAARLSTLDGKTIALLDNTKDRVDVLLGEVQALSQKDYPHAKFKYFRKESVSGAAPDLMEMVAACDAVVTAVGD